MIGTNGKSLIDYMIEKDDKYDMAMSKKKDESEPINYFEGEPIDIYASKSYGSDPSYNSSITPKSQDQVRNGTSLSTMESRSGESTQTADSAAGGQMMNSPNPYVAAAGVLLSAMDASKKAEYEATLARQKNMYDSYMNMANIYGGLRL